jgi:hypothetical protein
MYSSEDKNTRIPISSHLRIIRTRGTPGARITDLRSVVRTLRLLLHGRRLLLTSAANAQQQQHTSAVVYALTLLHFCAHAMRTLTWSAVAALRLCAGRKFELVRQRQAKPLRNCCPLAVRMQLQLSHENNISR